MNGATPGGPSVVITNNKTASVAAFATAVIRAKASWAVAIQRFGMNCSDSANTMTKITGVRTSGAGSFQVVKSRLTIVKASFNVGASKKIHPKQTMWNVTTR